MITSPQACDLAPHRTTGGAARATAGALALVAGLVLTGCQTGTEPVGSQAGPSSAASTVEPSASAGDSAPTPSPTPSADAPGGSAEPSSGPSAGAVNGPNSITSPEDGDTVAGPAVTVTGEGTAFEATLSYRVLVAGTEDVAAEGFTEGGANGEVGPFTFTVDLAPGRYTVQVWEADMSDGASASGPYRNLVQVEVTVQ